MPSKDEQAIELAQKHYQVDVGITQILRIMSRAEVEVSPAEPIKLLEVNELTVPSGVLPLQFGADPEAGIYYPSVIVEVMPEEFEKIKSHELPLPSGWMIGEVIPRQGQGA
jgi:hypothetical protein